MVRQYQTMGDQLDKLRTYGFEGGIEALMGGAGLSRAGSRNGYSWLTKDIPHE